MLRAAASELDMSSTEEDESKMALGSSALTAASWNQIVMRPIEPMSSGASAVG